MKRRVVVTGAGVISPVGNNKQEFWASLINGRSGICPLRTFDCRDYDSRIAGEIKNFTPHPFISKKELRRMEKFVQFAVTASKEAVDDSGLDIPNEDPYR